MKLPGEIILSKHLESCSGSVDDEDPVDTEEADSVIDFLEQRGCLLTMCFW